MSNNDVIAPVPHDALSSVGTTAAEAGKGGLKGALWGVAGGAVLGVGLAVTAGVVLSGGWAVAGVIAALAATPFIIIPTVTGLFSAIGIGFGTAHGVHKVSQEKGASEMLQAQVAVAQAQAAAMAPQTNVYTAPSSENKYNFAAQGSAMNPAASTIDTSTAQNMGRTASAERQVA